MQIASAEIIKFNSPDTERTTEQLKALANYGDGILKASLSLDEIIRLSKQNDNYDFNEEYHGIQLAKEVELLRYLPSFVICAGLEGETFSVTGDLSTTLTFFDNYPDNAENTVEKSWALRYEIGFQNSDGTYSDYGVLDKSGEELISTLRIDEPGYTNLDIPVSSMRLAISALPEITLPLPVFVTVE